MTNYEQKFIKYVSKYSKIQLQNAQSGGAGIHHVYCNDKSQSSIFYNLSMQLLIELEAISSPASFTFGNVDNLFLPILKFIEYNSPSTSSLLTKQQLQDSITLISKQLTPDVIGKYQHYRDNILSERCKDALIADNKLMEAFNDSRNYSLYVMLNTIVGYYDNSADDDSPILIYKINDHGIIDGHVFLINHHTNGCLEAIGIQQSLELLSSRVCEGVKYGLSIELFTYIMHNLLSLFKSATYIYAHAWNIMSTILIKKFNFMSISYFPNNPFMTIDADVIDNTKHITSANQKYIFTTSAGKRIDYYEQLDKKSVEYAVVRDLKKEFTSYKSNVPYVFTVLKL